METPLTSSKQSLVRVRWRVASWLATWMAACYLVIVLPVERVFPALNHWMVATPLMAVLLAFVYVALDRLVLRGASAELRAINVTLLTSVALVTILGADVGFTAYRHLTRAPARDRDAMAREQLTDAHVWNAENMPVSFTDSGSADASRYHLRKDLRYKPGQRRTAETFGELYYSSLLRHPLIRDSVLQLRRVEYVIDRYGFRNVDPPDSAAVFVLGDSFAFGLYTSQEETYVQLMKAQLGAHVYNMGIAASSPVQQVYQLDRVLRLYPNSFRPKRVFWVIFEGNDLEESIVFGNDPYSPRPTTLRQAFDGTIVGGIYGIPALLRRQSIIRSVIGEDVVPTNALSRKTAEDHYLLDGETLAHPLFRSRKLGYRLFRQAYLDRAGEPESYVREHPNLPTLVSTFQRMRSLATTHGFAVTVVLAPTDVRLYKNAFEDFPPISDAPHFLRRVGQLARENGFDQIDLHALLAPHADTTLMYYRDDSHWNPVAHRIVAGILVEHLRSAERGSQPR